MGKFKAIFKVGKLIYEHLDEVAQIIAILEKIGVVKRGEAESDEFLVKVGRADLR